jgi:uncharacterized repeat protein (TIGR01451 family)
MLRSLFSLAAAARFPFTTAALVLSAVLSACSDEPTLPIAATRDTVPSLTSSVGYVAADPTSISFANTIWHMSRTDTVTLTNTGGDTVAITDIAIAGANALDFNWFYPNGNLPDCSAWIAPGAQCLIGVQFTPQDVGQRSASLAVALPSGVLSVPLAGEGIRGALSYSPSSLSFADQNVGSTSSAQIVTIRNTGTADMQVWSIKLQGTNPGDFAVAPPSTNACVLNAALAPNASCDIGIAFAPAVAGGRSAQLVAEISDVMGTIGAATVSLSGQGVAISSNQAADLAVSFGPVPNQIQVGRTLTYPITVKNAGPGTASNIALTASVPSGTGFAGLTVPNGVSCSAPATGDSGGVFCSISSMAAGSAYTVQVVVKTLSGNRTVVTNTAYVSSGSSDPVSGNNSATVTTTVKGRK